MFLFKLVVLSIIVGTIAFADNVPTIHQIYQAVESGDLNGAHQMAVQVLKEHPDSAKAHFVDAEILVRQGHASEAKNELKIAEKLAPGLPFAKPQAVESLKQLLDNPSTAHKSTAMGTAHSNSQPFPWMMVILGLGAILLIWLAIRAFSTRNTGTYPAQNNGNNGVGGYPNQNNFNNPQPGFGAAQQPYPQQSGGLGSGIMTGLATGAAAGVGIVAGEALMHHFMDGSTTAPHENMNNQSFVNNNPSSDDMGGNDFGIKDDSSWDDNSSDDMSDSSDDKW